MYVRKKEKKMFKVLDEVCTPKRYIIADKRHLFMPHCDEDIKEFICILDRANINWEYIK